MYTEFEVRICKELQKNAMTGKELIHYAMYQGTEKLKRSEVRAICLLFKLYNDRFISFSVFNMKWEPAEEKGVAAAVDSTPFPDLLPNPNLNKIPSKKWMDSTNKFLLMNYKEGYTPYDLAIKYRRTPGAM